jgi:transcription elongation factor SPT4
VNGFSGSSLARLVSEWQERMSARMQCTKSWFSSRTLDTQPTSQPTAPRHLRARQNPAKMPPKRKGIAAVKKAPSKYYVVDSDSEQLSEIENAHVSRAASKDEKSLQTAAPEQRKGPPDPQRRSRQETGSKVTPVAGHSTLAHTLFNDLEHDTHDNPGIILADIVESIEPPTGSPPLAPCLRVPQRSTSRFDSAFLKSTSLSSPADPRPFITDAPSAVPRGTRPVRDKSPNIPPVKVIDYNVKMSNSGNYIPTSQARHMRACMVCSIVRTYTAFLQSGCPNCDGFLELTGNGDAIQDCTSQVFEGLLTVSNTSRSWVARYQRLEGYVPGVYAVQVEGILPEDAVVAAEQAGVHYIPRDGSVSEALPNEGM